MGLKASNQICYASDQLQKKIPKINFCESRSAKYPELGQFTLFSLLPLSSSFAWECVREETGQNPAGGETAEITNFAQTWHKCWVWWVKHHGKKVVRKIFYSMKKWPIVNNLCTYQCQAGGGWGGGEAWHRAGFRLIALAWGRAFEFSCCTGGRDI